MTCPSHGSYGILYSSFLSYIAAGFIHKPKHLGPCTRRALHCPGGEVYWLAPSSCNAHDGLLSYGACCFVRSQSLQQNVQHGLTCTDIPSLCLVNKGLASVHDEVVT